jgi:integrase
MADNRKLQQTRFPGIFKRVGGKTETYVFLFKHEGRQRRGYARTLGEARELKAKRMTQVAEGTYREQSRQTFAEYARAWIPAYMGKGRGFRDRTRRDYKRDLERYAIPFLGSKRVGTIRRADIQAFVAWLADDREQAERHRRENAERKANDQRPLRSPGPLRDRTVARILAVLSACFSSAVLDEIRPDNPVGRVVLPKRDPVREPNEDDELEDQAKALTREQIQTVIALIRSDWRPFFRLLAATGLRLSEALALDVSHLRLDGSDPHVRVRRAFGRAESGGATVERAKSTYGVRDVPLPRVLVSELREHLARLPEPPAKAREKWGRLVFASQEGTPVRPENLRRRILWPATEEADVSWAGFHAFRHSFASMHIERGTNIVRLSRLMGHHSPSFTLNTYGHLLDDGFGDALEIDAEIGSHPGSPSHPETDLDNELATVLQTAA